LPGTSDFAPFLPFQLKSATALGDPAPVIPKAGGFLQAADQRHGSGMLLSPLERGECP
jgi:hypothetical protein